MCEKSLDELKENFVKVQVAFQKDCNTAFLDEFDVISKNVRSSITELVMRGNKDEITQKLESKNPVLIDVMDLTLEDIFIYEMEDMGYDFSKLLS